MAPPLWAMSSVRSAAWSMTAARPRGADHRLRSPLWSTHPWTTARRGCIALGPRARRGPASASGNVGTTYAEVRPCYTAPWSTDRQATTWPSGAARPVWSGGPRARRTPAAHPWTKHVQRAAMAVQTGIGPVDHPVQRLGLQTGPRDTAWTMNQPPDRCGLTHHRRVEGPRTGLVWTRHRADWRMASPGPYVAALPFRQRAAQVRAKQKR